MPARNEAHWIGALLASLVASVEPNTQVIVVLSDSTDGTREVVDGFRPELSVEVIECGPGPGAARNLGAAHATADWCLFVDADVQLPTAFFEQLPAPDARRMYGFRYVADDPGLLDRLVTRVTSWYFRLLHRLGQPAIPGFAMLVPRADFLGVGGFDERLEVHEDFDLERRLREAGVPSSICATPWVMVSSRRMRGSWIHRLSVGEHLLRTEVGRLFLKRRYAQGSVRYDMGDHPAPIRRRTP